MTRVLLVTNDFPPRPGGIQSYLEQFVGHLAATGEHQLTVYAPRWKGCEAYDRAAAYRIVRHPGTLMLPEPGVDRRMRALIAEDDVETVWFGAAAPLALLASRARQRRRPAGAGQHARPRGGLVDASGRALGAAADRRHHRRRDLRQPTTPAAGSPPRSGRGRTCSICRRASTSTASAPTPRPARNCAPAIGLGQRPTVVCVSRLVPRKGQDMLIKALPDIRRRVDGAALVIVGGGPHGEHLHRLAREAGVTEHVVFTGGVPSAELPAHYAMADVFAMPCRTRGYGMDVEGLGIVFLEASASGVPVVAGRSGGAPETVRDGETGRLVDGRSHDEIVDAVGSILADPELAARMGAAGRSWISRDWSWPAQTARLSDLVSV